MGSVWRGSIGAPLLPLTGCGGWSDGLHDTPPDERQNAPILPWDSIEALASQLRALGLIPVSTGSPSPLET